MPAMLPVERIPTPCSVTSTVMGLRVISISALLPTVAVDRRGRCPSACWCQCPDTSLTTTAFSRGFLRSGVQQYRNGAGDGDICCRVPSAQCFLSLQLHLWHSHIPLPSLAISNLSPSPLAPCTRRWLSSLGG